MYDREEILGDFERALNKYKEAPETFSSGIFYLTPDNSTIEAIHEDEHTVFGVIRNSPIKSSIGLCRLFVHAEVRKIPDNEKY